MHLHHLHALIIDTSYYATRLAEDLVQIGFTSEIVGTYAEARGRMDKRMPDMTFLGIHGKARPHISFLKQIKRQNEGMMTIVMSKHLTSKECEEALALGAYDCVTQPLDKDNLRIVVLRALKRHEVAEKASMAVQKRAEQLTRFSDASDELMTEIDSLKAEISELYAQAAIPRQVKQSEARIQ